MSDSFNEPFNEPFSDVILENARALGKLHPAMGHGALVKEIDRLRVLTTGICPIPDKLLLQEKMLIITVGFPYCGMTEWALSGGCPIVSPGDIHLALTGQRFTCYAHPMVQSIAMIMIRALFLVGHNNVVLRATNVTRERRTEWKSSHEWESSFACFPWNRDLCENRAKKVGDEAIIPIIHRMSDELELIEDDEGHHLTIPFATSEKYIKECGGPME